MRCFRYFVLGFILHVCVLAQEVGTFQTFKRAMTEEELAMAPTALLDALGLLYYGSSGATETAFEDSLFAGKSRLEVAEVAKSKRRTFSGYRSIGSLSDMGAI